MTVLANNQSFYTPDVDSSDSKFYNPHLSSTVKIGITYLDKNKFGIKDLVKSINGNKSFIEDIYKFLEVARKVNNLGDFIKLVGSHTKIKNEDDESKKKVRDLNKQYNLEIQNLIHLHCQPKGMGSFVIHGFDAGNNIFEIVWLDAKHELHES